MNLGRYLPSAQFAVIVGSIVISGGLVVVAQHITNPDNNNSAPTLASATPANGVPTGDWLAALREIEGPQIDAASTADTDQSAQTLLEAAQSSNVTDTVARTLLVNVSQAKSQGLGSDIPTQEALMAQAASQINQDRSAPTYTSDDLILSDNSAASLKAYGNTLVTIITRHPTANYSDTLYAIGTSTDNADPARLATLKAIGKDYAALTLDLAKMPVPPRLAPLHLQVLNDLSNIAATYTDMEALYDDPVRGLSGFQLYQALNQEVTRVFINIAQELSQNGILFSKDEPGSAWSSFLSQQ